MRAGRRAVVVLALLSSTGSAWAAPPRDPLPPDEPWEAELAPPAPAPAAPSGFAPLADLALAGIDHYRAVIGPRSVARCPFVCTCSAFASAAIRRYGFWPGLVLFVDRFFFRENRQVVQHYEAMVAEDGRLRFSDAPGARAGEPCP